MRIVSCKEGSTNPKSTSARNGLRYSNLNKTNVRWFEKSKATRKSAHFALLERNTICTVG